MSLIASAIRAGEGVAWPDPLLRASVSWLVGRTKKRLHRIDSSYERQFSNEMEYWPIAINTEDANAQHYEVPPALFSVMLGPQRKYSCCYYRMPNDSLAQAEEAALSETALHADLSDGQHILELGCGWGSLSLWMARRYPSATITSVSNSYSQRLFIETIAREEGLKNLSVVTADMNTFETHQRYDRVVSVEMFEHMSNWTALLSRIASWLHRDGALFIHVFSHRNIPYRFDPSDKSDWIAQHFFTGGIMPSHGLIRACQKTFAIEQDWRWSGNHYRRTADHWLSNFDNQSEVIERVLRATYGADTALWRRRWRIFLLATSGLFGHDNGNEWGVSHYRLRPVG